MSPLTKTSAEPATRDAIAGIAPPPDASRRIAPDVCLALDVTCLLFGPLSLNPRGIDRVEMAYAAHFLETWPGPCVVVMPTAWGMRFFDRQWALRGLRALERIWQERLHPDDDPSYRRTKAFLRSGEAQSRDALVPAAKSIPAQARDFLRLLWGVRLSFGKPVRALPHGTVYLNVGQLLFFRPWLSWLTSRDDITRVFMIHDLIPLEYPDHHVRLGVRLHERIVANAAEMADALIMPSAFARQGLSQPFVPARLAKLPVHVEWLPVSPAFLGPRDTDPDLETTSYFLACGAIDAHKNHIVLLQAWVRLVALRGADAPKLVIAGFRSVTSDPVFAFLAQHPAIHRHVHFVSGLSTPSLRRLMAQAQALLMPSLVEGFGLPIVEALAQGTPVLASDIPAFREAGRGGRVLYLPATQPAAWLAAIMDFQSGFGTSATIYRPKRWTDYFANIESFLATVTAFKGAR